MSQEKVDRYKKEKANRAQIQKKEKRIQFLEIAALGAICLVAAGWVGYSAYTVATRPDENAAQETVTTEMDVTALNEYLSGLSAEDAE